MEDQGDQAGEGADGPCRGEGTGHMEAILHPAGGWDAEAPGGTRLVDCVGA